MAHPHTTMKKRPKELFSSEGAGVIKMAEDQEELLTVREVAHRLRVDDTTVRRWIKNDSLEAITLPHRAKRLAYRVKKSTMDKLLGGSALPE